MSVLKDNTSRLNTLIENISSLPKDRYEDGYSDGYTDGAKENIDYTVEDGFITRTISGDYVNDRVTLIGNYACIGCRAITSIFFPLVTQIGSYALESCSAMTIADLPNCERINSSAFAYCSKLSKLILRRTDIVCVLPFTSAFTNTPVASGTGYVYVPDNLVEEYKAATNWSNYANQIKPLSELEGDA